jgi:RNA polymerase sigma-70 factor (ECF subfamily)
MTDDDLVARLRRRDPETIKSIVVEHARPLYRAARGMGFSLEDAEDLVQESLAAFLESLDRFQGRSQVRTWLFGILHNKVMERRREVRREDAQDPIDEVFESRFDAEGGWIRPPDDLHRLLESRDTGEAIQGCMEGLPAAQREAFILREVEGLETGEMCKILGASVTNIGVLLHRARHRLRECLEARGWRRKP